VGVAGVPVLPGAHDRFLAAGLESEPLHRLQQPKFRQAEPDRAGPDRHGEVTPAQR
jgi:hypothetical protein